MADFNSGRVWAAWATSGTNMDSNGLEKIEKLCDKWRKESLCATDRIGGWPGGFQYKDIKTANDSSIGMMRIVDDRIRGVFENHQRMAVEESKFVDAHKTNVDPYLHMAGLKNNVCGYAIEAAVKEYIFPRTSNTVDLWEKYKIDYIAIHYAWARTYLYWSKEMVKDFYSRANWNDAEKLLKSKNAPMSALYSAKHFVEACVEADLGIRFAAQ